MMHQLNAFSGALTYELRMQIRRPAVWLTCLGFAALTILLGATSDTFKHITHDRTPLLLFADTTSLLMLLFPIATGLLLADRLPRDRTTKVSEILATLPTGLGTRLWGKYAGTTIATLTPVFLAYIVLVGYLLVLRGSDFVAIPLALLPFVAVVVPGMLFVAAFSLACPSIIWVPLYQFLFIGYWFWGNLLALPALPTLNGTLLTPAGGNQLEGFFGADGSPVQHATAAAGTASIALFLALAVVVLTAVWGYLRRQQQAV